MASFGESLRQERLRRNISLDEVAAATKIKSAFLKAIEDEDLLRLPGGVFNRNFVRTYALYLGLDESQYVEEYIRSTGDSAQPSALPNPPAGSDDPLISATTLVALLIGAVLVLVVWAGYHVYQQHRQGIEQTARPAEREPARQAMLPVRPLIAPPNRGAAADSPDSHAAGPQSASTPVAAGSASVPVNEPIPPTPPGEMSLLVEATTQPAWIQVFTDGHWQMEDIFKPGQRRVFFFHDRVQVNSGNAGATVLSINGKPVGALGKIGMVDHFYWPASTAPAPGSKSGKSSSPPAGTATSAHPASGAAASTSGAPGPAAASGSIPPSQP